MKKLGRAREFEVVGLLNKHVGAPVARKAYVDRSPERSTLLNVSVAKCDRGAGRPTRKDHRTVDRLMGLGD